MVDHLDAGARREAKRILKPLLVKAQVGLRAGQQPAEAFRPAAVPFDLRPYMKRSNIAGVHIYQDGGGWQADVLLKTTASGGGTVIGTDMERPCATREEAVQAAVDMLATVVLIETGKADFETGETGESETGEGGSDPDGEADADGDQRIFDLEGLRITLEPGFRDKVPQSLRDIVTSEVTRTLTGYLSRDFPEGMTQEGFDALAPERQGSYAGLAATLLQRGVTEFRRENAPMSR